MFKGRCECGAVAFKIEGALENPSLCHCSQCRRLSGHAWSGAWLQQSDLNFSHKDGLTWYRSSDHAERGFCAKCGSSLFYHLINDEDRMSVAPGCLDAPTGLNIYVADKGDYYDIGDGLPQLDRY